MIVVAISGLFMLGVTKFFRDTFDIWRDTRDSADVHSSARTAINEMSKYIRQSSTHPITIGASNDLVEFEIAKSTDEWHADLTMRYFKDGTALKRFMKGSTTTMISSGVSLFYVWSATSTAQFTVVGTTVTVASNDINVSMGKKVMLRRRE